MRIQWWVLVLGFAGLCVGPVQAAELIGPRRIDALCGPPCSSPPGYAVPPCCHDTHPCCQNAWAGYCEEVAPFRAWWARIGAPKEHACKTCSQCAGGAVEATAVATPARAPVSTMPTTPSPSATPIPPPPTVPAN